MFDKLLWTVLLVMTINLVWWGFGEMPKEFLSDTWLAWVVILPTALYWAVKQIWFPTPDRVRITRKREIKVLLVCKHAWRADDDQDFFTVDASTVRFTCSKCGKKEGLENE